MACFTASPTTTSGTQSFNLTPEALKELQGSALYDPQSAAMLDAANKRIMTGLTGGVISPAEQAQLDTLYGSQRTLGTQAITDYAKQLAAMRNMTVTDSPIANEALKQKGNLETALTGAQAGSALQLGNQQQNFANSISAFQNNLKQQAFLNRLSLAGQSSTGSKTGGTNFMSDVISPVGNILSGSSNVLTGLNTLSGGGLQNWAKNLFSGVSSSSPTAGSVASELPWSSLWESPGVATSTPDILSAVDWNIFGG
jgi:hypothetical protein